MNTKNITLWIISDDSHRVGQSTQLAKQLGTVKHIISLFEVEQAGSLETYLAKHFSQTIWPDIAIGTGERTANLLLEIKQKGKSFAVSILDPQKNHASFDAIVVPSYEPHSEEKNIITTIGLINHINPDFLKRQTIPDKLSNLDAPHYAVIVGGRHVGGNITSENAQELAKMLNGLVKKTGGSLIVSTSKRTEDATTESLKQAITVPYFFYDYKHNTHISNPYYAMLSYADSIIVTGDSLRMCSESCSSGKPVYIYMPAQEFSPYHALHEELYRNGHAKPFKGECDIKKSPSILDEAKRVAEQIKSRFF